MVSHVNMVKGSILTPRAAFPASRLSSVNRYSLGSRMLSREAISHWNAAHRSLLDGLGVKIIGIEEIEIKPAIRTLGHLEAEMSESATLAAALPALAVALKGRGDLLDLSATEAKAQKKGYKETADLRASATELEVFYSVAKKNPDIAFLVRVGEGGGDAGRRKPGEALNASLYPGQIIVNDRHVGKSVEELERAGVKVYRIATDPVEGTTKTVMSDDSALTSILIVDGEIRQVPDVYMEKVCLDAIAAGNGLTTDETLDKLVQGLSDTHRVTPNNINNFTLNRPRHPIQVMLDLGINIVLDSDGDLMPAISPGAMPGVYNNGLPLHSLVGDTGGAAEYLIAASANQWLGGESHGRFVSATGMKAGGWEGRYDFDEAGETVITEAGFSLGKNYPISSLVELGDGLAVFGGITDNAHYPYMNGVYLGANYAQVDVIKIGSSGRMTKRKFTFEFNHRRGIIVDNFSPVTEALMKCDLLDIRGEMKKILENPNRKARLHREIGLSLYQIFDIKGGLFSVNEEKARELADERINIIIHNLQALAPEWFV